MAFCTHCDADGYQYIRFARILPGGKEEPSSKPPTKIKCIYCDGTKERKVFLEDTIDWCKCKSPVFGDYPGDGECFCGVYHHHVHCRSCGKICQLG